MPRHRRPVAAFCIAVIVVAALMPGAAWLDAAYLEPIWVLLPDEAPVEHAAPIVSADEQPLVLFSILSSRGPPEISLA
jgi:hypothetical protein